MSDISRSTDFANHSELHGNGAGIYHLTDDVTDAGMSTRAIAPIVGVSQSSVRDDLQVSRNYSPAPSPTPSEAATHTTVRRDLESGGTNVPPAPNPTPSEAGATAHDLGDEPRVEGGCHAPEPSTPAIAPIVGVSVGTIHADQVFNSEHLPPAPNPTPSEAVGAADLRGVRNLTPAPETTPSEAAATALVLADIGKRKSGRWERGSVVNPESGTTPGKTWQNHMLMAGTVLDHAPDLAPASRQQSAPAHRERCGPGRWHRC